MSLKRTLAILALAGVLGTGAVNPAPVHADNTAIIIAAAIGTYVGLLFLATALVYRTPPPETFAPDQPNRLRDDRQRADAVRLAPGCVQQSQGLTLVCW